MPDNTNTEPKDIIVDEDNKKNYTEEQKKRDILLSNFQNIARYMDTEMHDNENKLAFKNISDLIIDDYDLSKLDEDRFNFYMELQKILRKDPRILNIIMNLNTRIKIKKKKERKIINQLVKILKGISTDTPASAASPASPASPASAASGTASTDSNNAKSKEEIITALQNVLLKNYNLSPSTQNNSNNKDFDANLLFKYLKQQQGGNDNIKDRLNNLIDGDKKQSTETQTQEEKKQKKDILENANKLYKKIKENKYDDDTEDKLRGNLALHYGMNNLGNLTENILKNDNDHSDKFERDKNSMEEFIDDYYKAHSQKSKTEVASSLQKALDKFDTSPTNVLETIKITREDRLIFIFVSFFIRYITILMVQWCIDINIIKDFYQGFLLYAVIYNILFWFIVMLVNINNITPVSYMNTETSIGGLQNMFYYFYMGTNGISRLLTHSILIILLLLIPILLNIHHKKDDTSDEEDIGTLSYEDRKKLTKTLSLFTIFIWVLTSLIAIKY